MTDEQIDVIKEFTKLLIDKADDGIIYASDIVDYCFDFIHQPTIHQPTKIEHNSLCETETYESR